MRLSISALLALTLLTGCGTSPDVPLVERLSHYDTSRQQCDDFISGKNELTSTIEKECKLFLDRLETANYTANKLASGKLKQGEAKEKKILYARERNNLLHDYQKLSSSVRDATLETIKHDDTDKFLKGIAFPGNTFIQPYYDYMKSKAPRFETNVQYLTYEKAESERLRQEAEGYLKKGHTKQALVLFEKAAQMNNAAAAHATGIIYEEIDHAKAISWHKVAVKGGATGSYLNLGLLYEAEGKKEIALGWYLKAAKENNPQAQYQLYKYFLKDDKQQALSWLKKSSENSYLPAQFSYAVHLIAEDKTSKAIDLLQNASINGYTKASDYLGQYYYELAFYGRAFKVLARSESGDSFALQGKMFEEGKGVKVDYRRAYILYSRANALGNKDAKASIARVNTLMSNSQQQMAAAYKAEYSKIAAKMVKECGAIPTPKTANKKGKKFHITGTASAPTGHDFVIYGDDGEDYYVQNAKKMSEDEHVDIAVMSTGRTATMTYADEEKSVEINQFTYIKKCIIEKKQ